MSFDPNAFLDQNYTESNSTVSTPVPEGEYIAVAEKVDVRSFAGKKDPTQTYLMLDVVWEIDDANVKALLERDKVTCKQGIMLDVTESGGLDFGKGKNVGLGRLREAVNLNTAGQPFSFQMIPGRMAKVSIKHRVDGEAIYAEVKAVGKIG